LDHVSSFLETASDLNFISDTTICAHDPILGKFELVQTFTPYFTNARFNIIFLSICTSPTTPLCLSISDKILYAFYIALAFCLKGTKIPGYWRHPKKKKKWQKHWKLFQTGVAKNVSNSDNTVGQRA